MTTPNFSDVTLSRPPDRRFYTVEVENPTIRTEFEGGYIATRPRHKRTRLRRTFTTGYTDISHADKAALETFYNTTVRAGALAFFWLDVHDWEGQKFATGDPALSSAGFVRLVRFVEPLKFTPKGFGQNLRWEVGGIKLEEV